MDADIRMLWRARTKRKDNTRPINRREREKRRRRRRKPWPWSRKFISACEFLEKIRAKQFRSVDDAYEERRLLMVGPRRIVFRRLTDTQ